MRYLVMALLSATLNSGCVRSSGEPSPGPATVTAAPTAPVPGVRRIAYDGAGRFILPDGTKVEADTEGGFTLPNGAYVQPDGSGGVTLPNGRKCASDGAQGYICP